MVILLQMVKYNYICCHNSPTIQKEKQNFPVQNFGKIIC